MNLINNYLNITGKYSRAFETLIEKEKNGLVEFSNQSYRHFNFVFKLMIGVFVSDFILYLYLFRKKKTSLNKIVFVTHYSHTIKFKPAQELFDPEEYSILYVPTVHIKSRIRHFNTYKNKNNVHFKRFGFSSFFLLFKIALDYSYFRKLKNHFSQDYSLICRNIVKYKLYDHFSKRTIGKEGKLWIFDNDRDPSFTSFIKRLNDINVPTVNLQHGMFFANNKFYLPSIAEYIFSCSDREKELFVNAGAPKEKVLTIGAPLQIYGHEKELPEISYNKRFNVLVLLTCTKPLNALNSQIELLKLLRKSNSKVLLRFRPASYENDFKSLKDYITPDFEVSKSDLKTDILNSEKIISYSFDAMYNCILQSKQTIIIAKKEIVSQLKPSGNPRVVDYESVKLLSDLLKDNFVEEMTNFTWNFGEIDFNDYRANFRNNCFRITSLSSS